MPDLPVLLSFGHGYSARALGRRLIARGWQVIGTTRNREKLEVLKAEGVESVLWPLADGAALLERATHVLISAGPDQAGDPTLTALGDAIRERAEAFEWVGYLSTTGVYGDRQGGWVDEGSECHPSTRRGQWRLAAEKAWSAIPGLALHIFRLAGIYGPGRGPFEKVRNGTARRIVKPGQVFSRIHVEDISRVLEASIASPNPGAIYNVCDNEAAPPQDVLAHAAALFGVPLPPEVDFETADMSPMARSFYAESKRVSNRRIREELGVELLYPSYREGLSALLREDA